MLVANAGSGKTYALTTRIIQLMLAGVPVDRIAALTFTRKSAGEFLDELLIRLADAATDTDKLGALAEATHHRELTNRECCELLRQIVEHFGRLGLSTIDSFFARVARQFPLESGLPEEFAIADTASLASARERALAQSFAIGAAAENGLVAMIEQCRQISRKNGERNVFAMMLRQMERLHQRFLETPADATWGDPAAIWPDGMPFADAPTIAEAADAFERAAHATNPELSDEARTYLERNLQAIRALQLGQAWSDSIKKFLKSKLISEPKTPYLRLTQKKTGWLDLSPEVEAARRALADALFSDRLQQFLERAQGLFRFVARYESSYGELVRDAGLISFADITTLLAERAVDSDTIDALDWRTQVAYRIDQNFDHWLLDEFQDTSRTQWAILSTFIDEVVMDESGQRSLFYVGDTKQAIYGWRGGDADLFREIYNQYRPAIEEAPALSQSWRSTEPVIEMVNLVFGDLPIHADTLKLPAASVDKWTLAWNSHTVAEPIRGRRGFACWRVVEKDPDEESRAQHLEVLRILEEVDPVTHGIECAVLLRQNNDAAELAARLQAHGIPVAIEGKSNPCTDNPLGSAVLAALRAVGHPQDSLAAGIAQGFPSASTWGLHDLETFRTTTLQFIANEGYAATIQRWIELAFDDHDSQSEQFLASRAESLLAAAERFDSRASSDASIDAFIAAIEATEAQEAESRDAVRIMTIHQAKGLGFEMVIVSGLDGPSRSDSAGELVLGPETKEARWGMLLPTKEMTETDPVLRAQAERLDAESKTNELCSAYVALTRAKRACYVLSSRLPEKTTASHFGRHLALTLDENWSAGDACWFQK
jgi:ATP-dependent exoDNAse (exonuclease V) beta subunit